jgi:hypothetical protein
MTGTTSNSTPTLTQDFTPPDPFSITNTLVITSANNGDTTSASVNEIATPFGAPPTTIPEPSTMAICGVGLLAWAGRQWRRRKLAQ